ncbi:la-related protein 4 isoform X1 [Octopus bimaculoides]|uniref:HTH La-type RNA-binding domain-containing protein n=1 Tax=Octopus bimaculoides TaxID=37653 RepID=A0A0L8HD08_OCTBM|nr:la-related protein 4 isoform X1 [Octopus bimaculoides]
MIPGDVYYYSANSCVLCVQRKQKVTQKSAGLNPNATVFLSKQQDIHQWDDISTDGNFHFANGDINKLETGGGLFSTVATAAESPLQATSAEFTATPGTLTTSPTVPAADQSSNSGSAAASSGTIIGTTGIAATSNPIIYSTTETVALQDDSKTQLDGTLSEEQIRRLLKTQLEYYFSRENLTSDTYLMSQMDADQYVAISAVANFSQVQRLTNNHDLVVDVLRECQNVQVDDKGEKVRPNHNRCIVILREIPASTPVQDVETLFSGSNCPKFVSCEFAHNDNWYVTFDSDEDAQRAYQYLREEVKSFLGKPIMARIKAKPLIRSTYVPRNGLKPQFEQQAYNSTQRYAAYVPNLNFQQLYYPVMPSWPPAGHTIMDPSMVFAMNGYQATGVKLNTPGRHQFPNMRVGRTAKPNRLNQERASSDSRLPHDRHQNPNAHRSSPRSTENTHVTPPLFPNRKGVDNCHHSHTAHHHHSSTTGGSATTTTTTTHSSTNVDSSSSMPISHLSDSSKDSTAPQPQRKIYKNRRKREDDNSKLSRQTSSQLSTNNKFTEPLFEFESNSFPPLPGSQNNAASGEKFENKLSDVVRGTAKPLVKESVITAPMVTATSSPGTTNTNNAVVVSSLNTVAEVAISNQLPAQSPVNKDTSSAVAAPLLTPATAVSCTTTLTVAPAVTPTLPLSASVSTPSTCISTPPVPAAISQPIAPTKITSSNASATTKLNTGIYADNAKSSEPHANSLMQSAGCAPHLSATAASTTLTTAVTANLKESSMGAVPPTLPAHNNAPSNTPPCLPPSSLPSTSLSHSVAVSSQQGHHRAAQSSTLPVMTTSAPATSSGSPSAGSVASATVIATNTQTTKLVSTEEKSTSRLSYAQMVARKREPSSEVATTSIGSSDKNTSCVSQVSHQMSQQQSPNDSVCKTTNNNLMQQTGSAGTLRSQALKEQSQASAHSQLSPKELLRKDLEPKEQRFFPGRRPAKENRERQRRKTDRERTSK